MTNPLQQLESIRAKKAALDQEELTLMHLIIKEAKHTKLGSKTYELYGKKVVITTKENYTLDKAMLNTVWKETMPINRSYAYTLRQKDYDAIMKSGTASQKKLLSELITTSPAKPVVKIEA